MSSNILMSTIASMVRDGELDDQLTNIIEAVQARRAVIAIQAGMALQKGDRVRFADVPDNREGWVGIEAIVDSKAKGGKAVKIVLADNTPVKYIGRRRNPIRPGQVWTVPAEWLEVV